MLNKTVQIGPFPHGFDNRRADPDIPQGTLRDAVDVELLPEGQTVRRRGRTLKLAGVYHSLHSDGQALYAAKDAQFSRITRSIAGALSATVLRADLTPGRPLCYTTVNGETFYTNGVITGSVRDGLARPWGVERPGGAPVALASVSGGLSGGRYQVVMTFVDATGEESGCALTASVQVAEGGGILATLPQPVSTGITGMRVYVTRANGEMLFRYATFAVGTTSVLLGASATLGQPLETQFLYPPPPGQALCEYLGRIYIAQGPHLWVTEPLRYGLVSGKPAMVFAADIDVLLAAETGIYAVAEASYFLEGSGAHDFRRWTRLPDGAARGSTFKFPETIEGGWLGARGLCITDGVGGVKCVSDTRLALSRYGRAAALFRREAGVRSIIIAPRHLIEATPFVHPDYTAALAVEVA